jgi:hypothetical protein
VAAAESDNPRATISIPAIARDRQPNHSVSRPLSALIAKAMPVERDMIKLVAVADKWKAEASVVENAPYE